MDVSLGFNVCLFRTFQSLKTVLVRIGEEKVLAECSDAYVQYSCMRERSGERKKEGKKRVIPVRWSGLISEISSAKKFRRVHFSLSLSFSSVNACTFSLSFSLSACFLPPTSFPFSLAPSATRESPSFINVRHYRFSRGIAFLFLSLPRDTACAFNNHREKV